MAGTLPGSQFLIHACEFVAGITKRESKKRAVPGFLEHRLMPPEESRLAFVHKARMDCGYRQSALPVCRATPTTHLHNCRRTGERPRKLCAAGLSRLSVVCDQRRSEQVRWIAVRDVQSCGGLARKSH